MKTLVRSVLLLLVTVGFAPVGLSAGDAAKGIALYNICAACHGANAEGTAALNAPANAGQDPWYMTRQLKNFKAGIRGAPPDDTFGGSLTIPVPQILQVVVLAAVATLVAAWLPARRAGKLNVLDAISH